MMFQMAFSVSCLFPTSPVLTFPSPQESGSSCVRQSCYVWKTLFPWNYLSPLALTVFLPPLLHNSLILEGRGLMKISHLGQGTPKSLTLYIDQFWVSVLILIYCKKLFWCELSSAVICACNGCSNMSLGVILLLCYFSRIIVLGFPLSS